MFDLIPERDDLLEIIIKRNEYHFLVEFIYRYSEDFFLSALEHIYLYSKEYDEHVLKFNKKFKQSFRTRARFKNLSSQAEEFIYYLEHYFKLSKLLQFKYYDTNEIFIKLKGTLVEGIAQKFLVKRLHDDYGCFFDNCKVYCKGNLLYYEYDDNGKSGRRMNIDLAAWSNNAGGEFYECKSHPELFEIKDLEFLKLIRNALDLTKYKDASVVGGISIHTTDYLKRKFKDLPIFPIGRDRLCSISTQKILIAG